MPDPGSTLMVNTSINGRWDLLLPEHRAVRPEWPWWERERLDAMHRVITAMAAPGALDHQPLVYDIGAEEGDLPALWATWGARVALFEPNPRVWPNIRVIWEANQLAPPAWAFAGFAGPEHHIPNDIAYADIAPLSDNWPACAYGPVIGDHGFCNLWERPDLPRTTIDAAPGIPDVLTLDVEGAEHEVLLGAHDTLTEHRPVVFVSIHPAFMADMYGYQPERLQSYMADLGYKAKHLATDHEEHWCFEHPANQWRTRR